MSARIPTYVGFESRDRRHAPLFTRPIAVPSLHVVGERDFFVLRLMGHWLGKRFVNAQTHQHPGGHHLPRDVSGIVDFIIAHDGIYT